ncbi:hypothetical protein JB92DRAFT_2835549 [Gautieria morchelliformis]|nr:hypothetical protein JB92DRAFT_2835549 [Gautieria morchelliformis]
MLSRLDNLAVLTLDGVPMTRAVLQSIGRLKTLETLNIFPIFRGEGRSREAQTHEPMFELQETPFPALRRLALRFLDYRMDSVLQDALHILAGALSLRTMFAEDGNWLHRLLPLINSQLVSLCGDFTFVALGAFLRFIKGHAALQNLIALTLIRDLPDLRSFGGPVALASKVISNCPVAKLASPGSSPPGVWYRMVLKSGEA